MSSGNVFEKLFKVQSSIAKMVLDGKRDSTSVLRYFQRVVDDPDFISVLDARREQVTSLIPVDGWAAEWQRFYKEIFDLDVDFADVEIPAEQPGFDWVVMVAESVKLNQVWAKCGDRFRTYSYMGDNLDELISAHDRTSAQAYAKRFRDRIEADEENKDLSANKLAERGAQSITLLERLLLELWYYWRTGGHLDFENVTLCAGSRYSGGSVPGVDWDRGKLNVLCYQPGCADGGIRSRSAV